MTTGLGGEIPPPETDLERAFTLLAAFMSLLIAGYIIGNIVNLIGAMNESSEEFRNKMATINLYMKNKKVPEQLTMRVRNYYNHLWSRQGGLDDTSIMDNLPARLKTEVSLHINGDIVAKVDLFKETNQGFRNALVEVLKPEIYTPNDVIIKQGDVGTEMYFISQGIVDVLKTEDNPLGGTAIEKKVATLKEGAFFGEIALLLQSTRAATIRAQTYCDLYVLRKADLDRVLKSFPGERDIIVRKGMFKLLRDRLRRQLPKEPVSSVVVFCLLSFTYVFLGFLGCFCCFG
jgi:CRP-like cAMP-binding protein